MPSHHPDADLLARYVSGGCASEESMLLASHVSLCRTCTETVHTLEAVGGAMLDELAPAVLADDALAATLARIDSAPSESAPPPPARDAVFPAPLREFIGMASHEVPWQSVTPSLKVFNLGERDDSDPTSQLRLMHIRAGQAMPTHTHAGRELTLVLSGGFSDVSGHFLRGDLALIDDDSEHTPVADTDADCICLALNDGPIRPSSLVGRLVMPFVKF